MPHIGSTCRFPQLLSPCVTDPHGDVQGEVPRGSAGRDDVVAGQPMPDGSDGETEVASDSFQRPQLPGLRDHATGSNGTPTFLQM